MIGILRSAYCEWRTPACFWVRAIANRRLPGTGFAIPTLLIFCLLSAVSAFAQLSLPGSVEVPPDASVVIPLRISNGTTNVSAFQFELEWDESAMIVSVVLAGVPATSGKELHSAVLSSGAARCLIAGLNRNSIADGDVVQILILIKRSTPSGSYRLKLANVVAADPDGQPVSLNRPDVYINVQGKDSASNRPN